MRYLPLVLVLLAACSRKVPEHLRIDPPDQQDPAAAAIIDVSSALEAMLGSDPLGRAPHLPDWETLNEIDGAEALAAYVERIQAVERGEGQVERALQQLEDEWRASAAVALARGYRLRIAENHLARTQAAREDTDDRIVSLITALSATPTDDALPRTSLQWLVEDGPFEEPVRTYADRWVAVGWLASPRIPVQVLVPLLEAPQYDVLRATPTGKLLLARAKGASANTTDAWADLRRATHLALQAAAADRDSEQADWAEVRRAAADELGAVDPVVALLRRAADQLTAGATEDRAAGGALLALAALRWSHACGSPPCVGVDRIETVQLSEAWHADIRPLASIWRVIALKSSIDSLEVGRDTALFPTAMVGLVDALLGSGGGPLDVRLLRERRPSAATWLAIARAIGTEGVTDWEGTRAALGDHLADEARRAAALTGPGETAHLLARIARRAVP